MSSIELFGLHVVEADIDSYSESIVRHVKSGDHTLLGFSLNGEALSLAHSDRVFFNQMIMADWVQADGQSIVWLSRLFSTKPLPGRIATTDLINTLSPMAVNQKITFYLFGGEEGVAQDAKIKLESEYPGIQILGARSGFFNADEELSICEEINSLRPDILWLGLGKPLEQNFATRHKERLNHVKFIKTCGGMFDHINNKTRRAPKFVQKLGLEWLFRVMQEPRRLARRYIKTNFHVILLAIKALLKGD